MFLSRPISVGLTAVVLTALAAVSIACSSFEDEVPMVGDEGFSEPLAYRSLEGSSSTTAAFSGTVLLKGGCIALETEGDIYTIVWLDGWTSWDADSQEVTMRRSGGLPDLVATVGEFAELGGQLIEEDWESVDWVDWVVKPNPSCPRKLAVI